MIKVLSLNISDRSCISIRAIPEDSKPFIFKSCNPIKIGTLSDLYSPQICFSEPGCPDFFGVTKNLSTRTPNSRRHHLTQAAFRLFHRRAFERAACCLCHERTDFDSEVAYEILYNGKSFLLRAVWRMG